MPKKLVLPFAAGIAAGFLAVRLATGNRTQLEVVRSVSLSRYAGVWYEIARLPNRFERKCAGDVTATYTPRADGKITVVNRCRKPDGSMQVATGTAKAVNEGKSILKVSFFRPFYGDYQVMALDPEYRWALVGEPRRRYLWVLAREPQVDEALLNRLLERARAQGYDTAPLIRTSQPAATGAHRSE